jgi:VIT1/CCC1 family predicted Fe2+/Mn2+ transporter
LTGSGGIRFLGNSKEQAMTEDGQHSELEHEHTSEAIARRLGSKNDHATLGDFVLGAVDGTVTTFAIVCGAAGANLGTGVAIVLGLANVLADGISMAVGNYLKAKADALMLDRFRRMEEKHIQRAPEGEMEEIRQIYSAKGFEGDTLDDVVRTITEDRELWVDTMLTEEWGLSLSPPSPLRAGAVTFLAFVLAGLVPLLPLLLSGAVTPQGSYIASAIATAFTFLFIGAIRGKVAHESMVRSSLETLAMGGIAAGVAFAVGALLRGYVGVGSL